MPDIRIIRSKTNVRIELYPSDIANITTQSEVISSFTIEELHKIIETLSLELSGREQ